MVVVLPAVGLGREVQVSGVQHPGIQLLVVSVPVSMALTRHSSEDSLAISGPALEPGYQVSVARVVGVQKYLLHS